MLYEIYDPLIPNLELHFICLSILKPKTFRYSATRLKIHLSII